LLRRDPTRPGSKQKAQARSLHLPRLTPSHLLHYTDITQNRRKDGRALQQTDGIVLLQAWFNSRIRVIAARLPYSDDELKESKCPVRSKKITLYGSSIMLSKSNLCCHRLTIAIACRMHSDYVTSHASVVSRPPRR
ncbi:hypothetical protein AVEN_111197-1, partial [Araneus ventricosus]